MSAKTESLKSAAAMVINALRRDGTDVRYEMADTLSCAFAAVLDEIDALQAQISEIETGLKDAATVRVNMLRGAIANPFKDDCDRMDVLCRENEQWQARIAELEVQLVGRGEAVLYQQRNYHSRDGWLLWHQIHKDTYEALADRLAGNRVLRNNFEVRALYTAPAVVAFGSGDKVVCYGTYGSRDAVFISDAKQPGTIGEDASRENRPRDALVPGEIVLTFPTPEQALAVEAALLNRLAAPALSVWYGAMPESNGKTNWTAMLCRDGDISRGITISRSEYEDRVRYEADRMRFLIGEISKEPFILDYDAEKHSGYVEASRGVVVLPEWSEQDALTLLNADSDGPFGQSDVDSMLAFLGHVNVQISNKAYPATTITAAELDGLRKDAALLPIVVEAALEAAEDWSNYVEEDTAPRVCSEHVKNAIDAAMAGQDAAGGES